MSLTNASITKAQFVISYGSPFARFSPTPVWFAVPVTGLVLVMQKRCFFDWQTFNSHSDLCVAPRRYIVDTYHVYMCQKIVTISKIFHFVSILYCKTSRAKNRCLYWQFMNYICPVCMTFFCETLNFNRFYIFLILYCSILLHS
jgi:hypothetical protein